MKTKKRKLFSWVILITLLTGATAQAQVTGLKIMENVYNRPTGEDIESQLTMTLINSRGDRREREIKQFIKDFGDQEKKIMFFTAPADVRNTSFMSWSYTSEAKDDDQWIYLPALKKVKRISSDSKSDSFMGSDFTYDDLGDRHPSEDSHKILREESLKGEECYVVESIPLDENSAYSRMVSWIIKDKWIGLKREYYDEDEDLLKVLTVKSFDKIDGYWVLLHFEMHNVQKDHTTRMELANVTIDHGIADSTFTERMMKRGIK
jgi:outer membrane lipoprotein-sorting protein